MIELAIKAALERLTGLDVFPLLLPATKQEGVTFQRISDAAVGSGLSPTGLSDVRMQVNIYLVNNYTRTLQLDQAIWSEFRGIVHGELEGQHVQFIQRGNIQQDSVTLSNGSIQYRLIRDFILTVAE